MVILLLGCVSGEVPTEFFDSGGPPIEDPSSEADAARPLVGIPLLNGSEASPGEPLSLPLRDLASAASEEGHGDGVIIIGGGPAGLAAAAMVGEGAILLEAADYLGGRGRWSGAFLFLPDAPELEAQGRGYDATQLLDDWEGLTGGPPTVATSLFLTDARDTREWLAGLGLQFDTGHEDPIYHRYLQLQVHGGGAELADALEAGLPAGVDVRLETPATGLVFDGDRVVGVETDDGVIMGSRVIVATGGFVQRADLIERFVGIPAGSWGPSTDEGGRGAAAVWALRYGFELGAPDAIGWNANVTGIPSSSGTPIGITRSGAPPWVWVDPSGERFVDESAGWSLTLAAQVARRSPVWGVVQWDNLRGQVSESEVPTLEAARTAGVDIRCADDVDSLAAALRVPAVALQATIDEVADARDAGGYDRFGRPASTLPPLSRDLCGVRPGRIAAKNYGGLSTDLAGRVLDTDGRVVPGLWAVGEAAGMGMPGLGGAFGFDGSLAAVMWSGLRGGAIAALSGPEVTR